jgi:hypothetical protein
MDFQIVGSIIKIKTIAVGGNIKDIMRLQKQFGLGRWRKLKGIGTIRFFDGRTRQVELHWYEAHGIGKCKMKIKRFME